MSFMNWLNEQRKGLQEAVKRYQNKEFLDATVAGCALVAAADGQIEASEKMKMSGFIRESEALKVFPADQVLERFNVFVKRFEFDAGIGKGEALSAIGKLRNTPEAAQLVVRVCCAIGAADGDFDDREKAVVREICRELKLNPSDFSL